MYLNVSCVITVYNLFYINDPVVEVVRIDRGPGHEMEITQIMRRYVI